MNRSPRVRTARLAVPSARPSSQARLALLTGGVMLASMSVSSLGLLSARADEKDERKSRQYKIGAGVLAGAALYYGIKKRNPVATAAAGAGAYYAYKKSKEAKDRANAGRYGYNNPFPGNTSDAYPDDNTYNGNGYPASAPGYGNGYGNANDGYPVGAPGGYDYGSQDDYPRDVAGDDYGTPSQGGYAQNGGDYPDYGLSGLRGRRNNGSKVKGSKKSSGRSRRADR